MAKPMKHQSFSLDFMADKDRVIDMSDPGVGKTFVQIEDFARHYTGKNDRALVLAPKSLLESAWAADIRKFRPDLRASVAWAENRQEAFDADADIYITNIDAAKWLSTQKPAFFKRFNRLILDECFVAGTCVDTPAGPKAIEQLRIGDAVITSAGALPVTHVFRKETYELVKVRLEDETEFICTPNHPFATESGWVQARSLRGLRVMRHGIYEHDKQGAAILQPQMLENRSEHATDAKTKRIDEAEATRRPFRGNSLEQRNSVSGRDKTEITGLAHSNGTPAKRTWWKWRNVLQRIADAKTITALLGIPALHSNATKTGERLSARLQSGFCVNASEDSLRSGWQLARREKSTRSKERQLASSTRVESVSSIECPSSTMVYNLEVNGPHDYFVSGVLVHNCTNFKHATSMRSKAMAKIVKYFDIRRAMSGTFYGNKLTDVWHQTFLIDDGQRLGKSFFRFRETVCTPEQRGKDSNAMEWVEREGAAAAVASLLADITVRHRFEDCIDIPDNHEYTVPFTLPKKLMAYYKEMQNSSLLITQKHTITAVNAAVASNKLLQIASGAVYTDRDENGEGQYQLLDGSRYALIADLAEERKHSVVFFLWRHQKEELIRQFEARNISYCLYDGTVGTTKRTENVKHFQAGFYQVMLAHPASAGHGLTLTTGTATIWASPTYNRELAQQGKQRVYRNSQKAKTENIIIVAPGTIDELAHARCQDRKIKATELDNYLTA